MITLFVAGIPKGQPRPRAFSRNGKASVYDPGTAEGWKGCVAIAWQRLPAQPKRSDAISLEIELYFPRPSRLLAKKSPENAIPHSAKPDADNCAKAIMDALTQIGAWDDDALVYSLKVEKYYAPKNGLSGAQITIY